MDAREKARPEGPPEHSPGREAGVRDDHQSSTEGAALEASMVPRLRRSISPQSYPGLTAGPSHYRPFGPGNLWASDLVSVLGYLPELRKKLVGAAELRQ